jgi:hypothetical protein
MLLTASLLDNVVAANVDYTCVEEIQPSPFRFLKHAWKLSGLPMETAAEQQGISFMFFADEVRCVYLSDLYSLANSSMHHSLFVAGSSSVLRAITLSETKLEICRVLPFTTRAQYEGYFQLLCQDQATKKAFDRLNNPHSDDFFQGLHLATNGRIRLMSNILSEDSCDRPNIPEMDECERRVLMELKKKAESSGFNVFSPPTLSLTELDKLQVTDKKLSEMTDKGTLMYVPRDGATHYTFGCPRSLPSFEAAAPLRFPILPP